MARPIRPLLKTDASHLDSKYLRDYGVKLRRFDLDSGMTLDPRTGKPDANTKLFTKPISVTSMDQAVQDKRPWYSPFSHTERPLRWDEDLDDWWHAYLIGNHLSMYLRNHHNPNMLGLIEGTGWKGIT